MKFLVFTSPTEEGYKTPPTAKAFKEQIDFMKAAVAAGTIDRAYHRKNSAALIVNAESEAELEKFLQSIPLSESMKREVQPLEDLFDQMERVHAWLVENDRKLGRG